MTKSRLEWLDELSFLSQECWEEDCSREIIIKGLRFERTCSTCHEQYDVFLDDDKVGYVRLRHGYLRADCHGEVVYEAEPQGDGAFYDEDERREHLAQIADAINKVLNNDEDL